MPNRYGKWVFIVALKEKIICRFVEKFFPQMRKRESGSVDDKKSCNIDDNVTNSCEAAKVRRFRRLDSRPNRKIFSTLSK